MKQTIILGNIITVDEKRPFAKAFLDGVTEAHTAWQDSQHDGLRLRLPARRHREGGTGQHRIHPRRWRGSL